MDGGGTVRRQVDGDGDEHLGEVIVVVTVDYCRVFILYPRHYLAGYASLSPVCSAPLQCTLYEENTKLGSSFCFFIPSGLL